VKIVISGLDPELPGGMSKYVGDLIDYLQSRTPCHVDFFNETTVKRRAGMTSDNKLSAVFESIRCLRFFSRHLDATKPDVAHINVAHGLSLYEKALMARIARRRGVPALLHMHGATFGADLPGMPPLIRNWLKRSFEPPHQVLLLSPGISAFVAQWWPSVKCSVIPNSVPIPDYPVEKPDRPVTFGFIGFMDGRKGEDLLVEAFASLPAGSLLLAGDGPNRKSIESKAAGLEIGERIQFLGIVGGDRKEKFFREIDVLCLPSKAENLPIALLEGMSYGHPAIATRVGGVPDMIRDGEDGWLVEAGSLQELTAALHDAYHDASGRARRGESCRRRVEREFTWDVNGPKIVNLYESLARSR